MWHKEGVEFWVAGHHRFEESIMLKGQLVTNLQGLDEMIPVRAAKRTGMEMSLSSNAVTESKSISRI
jgi:hypothetical protein